MIRILPWDSDHFGFTIARADAPPLRAQDVAAAVAEAERERVRCFYLLAEANQVETWRAAVAHGFEPIDMRVEFDKVLVPSTASPAEFAVESDRERILAMASALFTDSRFFRDERFPRDRSAALFARWAASGFDDPAHFHVVHRRDGHVDAFITGGAVDGNGSIDLVGVAEEARGGGVGRALLAVAENELIRRGCKRATVVTQASNLAAQRLYERAGYVTRRTALWLHRWWR